MFFYCDPFVWRMRPPPVSPHMTTDIPGFLLASLSDEAFSLAECSKYKADSSERVLLSHNCPDHAGGASHHCYWAGGQLVIKDSFLEMKKLYFICTKAREIDLDYNLAVAQFWWKDGFVDTIWLNASECKEWLRLHRSFPCLIHWISS